MPCAGYEVPNLARIAQRVTALVSSTGGCERVWSAWDMIQRQNGNRLPLDRANDLVYMYCNARLIQRMRAPKNPAGRAAEENDEAEAKKKKSG